MTASVTLAQRCSPFLPPGSTVQHAFIGQAAPSRWYFLVTYLTGLAMPWIRYRCVAVTDGGIHVLEATKPSGGAKPVALVGTMPRATRLGPVSGRCAQVGLLGDPHWVHQRFHAEFTAADAEAPGRR